MSNVLFIGYSVEGTTDARFMEGIIQRTFEDIALTCAADIDVFPVSYISSPMLETFVDNVTEVAKIALDKGIQILCIHADADSSTQDNTMRNKIVPAFTEVQNMNGGVCKNLVAIIPVHMSEAWMLADKELFKNEIMTTKSNQDLGIARRPETIADPKQAIIDAIRIAQEEYSKKYRRLDIGSIYQPLGQKIPLQALDALQSYQLFKAAVREAFIQINYLHEKSNLT